MPDTIVKGSRKNATAKTSPALSYLAGGGEMGRRMRALDWARTPLDAPDRWPVSLRTTLGIILTARQPMFLFWGERMAALYNEAAKGIVASAHPRVLGQSAASAWHEIWDAIGPSLEQVRAKNEPLYSESATLPIESGGTSEPARFAISFSPIGDDDGGPGGVLCVLNETESFHEAMIGLSSELDVQALVQKVTDTATRMTRARFGAFFYNVETPEGGAYKLYTLSGASRESFEKLGMPRATPLFAPTFKGEGVIRIDDVAKDPRYGKVAPHRGMPPGHLPVRSYLAVPVVSRSGDVLGALFFGHPEPAMFDRRAERIARAIAAHAGVAIDNASLFGIARGEIEERSRVEIRLRESENDLRELDQRKNEFLATLAHELRNPLAPIRNGLEIMRIGRGNAGMVEQARTMMERQVHQMIRLVDDLLDVSRVSRGRIELRKAHIELATALSNAIETAKPLIDQNGETLTLDIPQAPIVVDADLTRLSQVFANLLNNAAKYSDKGGRIEVSVAPQPDAVEVRVKDDGIGIPPDMLEGIFGIFTQVDRSLEKARGGLGIGLSIAKRLVEMHGGSIVAKSAGPGCGSEFIVRLPVVEQAAAERRGSDASLPREGLVRRRVLIADDNYDAASSLAMVLQVMGNDVRVAHDGLEALAIAEAFRPDAVLLDIGMPGLNGYEVCKKLRERPATAKAMIVALTGWGQEEDRRRSREFGFDHHLVKPVEPSTLEGLLR